MPLRHWLASAYPPFAVPYFVYDVFAMFLCHRARRRLKGHEEPPEAPGALWGSFLRRQRLMVLHHAAMVLVCFPVATVSLRGALWGDRGQQGAIRGDTGRHVAIGGHHGALGGTMGAVGSLWGSRER